MFVRALSTDERQALSRGLKSSDAFTLRRCQILLASADGKGPAEIGRVIGVTAQAVRDTKAPWLNPIEPKWVHGKRAVVEPERKLTPPELRQRVCDYFDAHTSRYSQSHRLDPALGALLRSILSSHLIRTCR